MHLESTIEKHFCKRVAELGGLSPKTRLIGRRGFFDRMVVLPGGRVFFVELKRPAKSRTYEQQKTIHEEYRALGANVLLLYTIEQVDEWYKTQLS